MAGIGHNRPPPEDELELVRPGDWIALSRKVREHPIVGLGNPVKPADPKHGSHSRFEAWFDLLCLAQWRPSKIDNKGQVMTLEVGQLMGARKFLADRWNWTEKTVRGYLDRLEAEGMISRGAEVGTKTVQHEGQQSGQHEGRQKSNLCNVITISNYSRYQMLEDEIVRYVEASKRATRGPAKRPPRGHRRASEGPELNTSTQDTNNTPLPPKGGGIDIDKKFEEFWRVFPGFAPPRGRKTDKPKARETFIRIATNRHRKALRASCDEMIAGAKCYAATNPDPEFIPMPTTWLNGARWQDNYQEPEGDTKFWWQDENLLAGMTPDRWLKGIKEHANGIWPLDMLGPAPGNPKCLVPRSLVDELKLDEIYDSRGIKR